MADHLFVRLGETDTNVTTVVLNGEGRIVEPVRRSSLDSVSTQAGGRRVVVLVPGTAIVATRAELPKASQARLRQLLPYSLEDSFAADIESLHFAAGPRAASGELAVSVAARERVDAWLATLAAAGIHPHAMYSEADGVPDTPSTLNLVVEGQRVYGRRPDGPPFVLEGLSLPEVVDMLATHSETSADLQHLLVYLDADSKQARMAELAEIHPRVASLDVKESADGVLPRFAATLVFEPGTNLLQGPYAPKSDFNSLLRPWHAAAALVLAWALLSIGARAVEYVTLQREDGALAAQLATLCTRSFGSAQLSACTAEMQRRLAAAGQQSSVSAETFLSTLAVIADAHIADSRIDGLSYRNRVLDLQLTVPSATVLEAFRQEVSATNRFDVRIQSTANADTGVESRLQVMEKMP